MKTKKASVSAIAILFVVFSQVATAADLMTNAETRSSTETHSSSKIPASKLYYITDTGNYQFEYYPREGSVNKLGLKPLTVRTFYLETKRQGMIPWNLAYRNFLSMSVEEKRAIFDNFPAVFVMAHAPGMIPAKNIEYAVVKAYPELGVAFLDEDDILYLNYDRELPWIIEVIVNPYDGFRLPDSDWFKAKQLQQIPSLPFIQEAKLPK